jgi:hypothetical protein
LTAPPLSDATVISHPSRDIHESALSSSVDPGQLSTNPGYGSPGHCLVLR